MQYFTIMGAKAHVDGTLKRASSAGQEQQDWDVTNFYCRYLILSAACVRTPMIASPKIE